MKPKNNHRKPTKAIKSRAILRRSRELNIDLTENQSVHPFYQAHYVNLETGEFGIPGLIKTILEQQDAVFPQGIENTKDRAKAIAEIPFTEEIIAGAQNIFTGGTCRYPPQSIKTYLGNYMLKNKEVGKIQLTAEEDKDRDCCRPRCKWYLVDHTASLRAMLLN
jgi:hypothetical protein